MPADFLSFDVGAGNTFELLVNGRSLTAHMRDGAQASVAPVSPLPPALHLCHHRWRLLFEGFPPPGTPPSEAWLRVHSFHFLDGYPDLHFAMRQNSWVITASPRTSDGILYTASGREHVALAYAMRQLDAFFARFDDHDALRSMQEIWHAEYADEHMRIRRIFEAKLGHDPGTAPAELIERLMVEFPTKENREILLSGRFEMPQNFPA